jgi:hypothetical protein
VSAADGLEDAVWAAAGGYASVEQLSLLDADRGASTAAVENLMGDVEEQIDSARRMSGPERDQVVADFTQQLADLSAV